MEHLDLETLPLDPKEYDGTDWGGDGSDLDRPVRAHVLAALPIVNEPYPPPLEELLVLGEVDITGFAVGQEHVDALLRMARDRDLVMAHFSQPESAAPFHALDLLEKLDLSAHVHELIPLMDIDPVDLTEAAVDVLCAIGLPALEPLLSYLRDPTRWNTGRSRVLHPLEKIVERHPEVRDQVVAVISAMLAQAEDRHNEFVSFAISTLARLKAVEALPIIRSAFEQGRVDTSVPGSWGEVLECMEVEPEPDDPLIKAEQERKRARAEASSKSSAASLSKPNLRPSNKECAKRKTEKASRKTKRKKKHK